MQIPVTIVDVADIRSFECLLPTSVPVARVAARLAELLLLPLIGWDGRPLGYGLVAKGGLLLDPDATLSELNLPNPLVARLVPEIAAGADADDSSVEEETPEPAAAPVTAPIASDEDDDEEPEVVVGEQTVLLHDTELDTKPDVRIDVEVHREIEAFAAANRNKECAGLLLGSVETEGRGRIVHITAAIPAEGAVGTRASVSISLPAWESMFRARDMDYGDLRILGWFHTHAGWGVFMSDSDVFIHRHFFPHPNMVAYVLDPTTGRDGFFYWHEGKIGLCPSYGLVGNPSDLKPHSRKKKGEPKPGRGPSPRVLLVAGLVLLLACLGFGGNSLVRRFASGKGKTHTPAVVVTREQTASAERTYTISHRDNPWSICNRVYHNGDLAMPLMRYNGLSNVSGLQIGQKIKLPPKETLKKLARRR